ncbi:MAG: hypothetical protein D6768_13210 [Chloroflexi bacterium]|nr:MAG: hypothetical protein D6768_13210 [Chloroflexota bacterium]
MAISRSDVRTLTRRSMEMGARVLRGTLHIDADGIRIGDTDLAAWLAEYAGHEFMLVAATVGRSVVESDLKSCNICGRDYTGDHCPHCAEARARLRGN